MKPALSGMVAAITILWGSVVRAGNVEIGFVEEAELDRWVAGETDTCLSVGSIV